LTHSVVSKAKWRFNDFNVSLFCLLIAIINAAGTAHYKFAIYSVLFGLVVSIDVVIIIITCFIRCWQNAAIYNHQVGLIYIKVDKTIHTKEIKCNLECSTPSTVSIGMGDRSRVYHLGI